MSNLRNYGVVTTQALGTGLRIASVTLTPAAAAATLAISDAGGVKITLAAPANGGSSTLTFGDSGNGAVLEGACTLTTTGVGANAVIEVM